MECGRGCQLPLHSTVGRRERWVGRWEDRLGDKGGGGGQAREILSGGQVGGQVRGQVVLQGVGGQVWDRAVSQVRVQVDGQADK